LRHGVSRRCGDRDNEGAEGEKGETAHGDGLGLGC
jgi:hypothetical protein